MSHKDEMYALVCYLVIMDKFMDKSPGYIFEKANMLQGGRDAFAYLDYKNMARAIDYCHRWHLEVPKEWDEEYIRGKGARA